MARCPYGPHRLVVQRGLCRRCNGDVQVLAAVQALPATLFNRARQLWEGNNAEAAAALLSEALRLRPEFAEAHWLMAAIEAGRGRMTEARARLEGAARLGAAVDLAWLDAPCPEAGSMPTPFPDDTVPPQSEKPDKLPPPAPK